MSKNVTIREVTTSRQLKLFINLPKDIYKNDNVAGNWGFVFKITERTNTKYGNHLLIPEIEVETY